MKAVNFLQKLKQRDHHGGNTTLTFLELMQGTLKEGMTGGTHPKN